MHTRESLGTQAVVSIDDVMACAAVLTRFTCALVYVDATESASESCITIAAETSGKVRAASVRACAILCTLIDVGLTPVSGEALRTNAGVLVYAICTGSIIETRCARTIINIFLTMLS